MSRSLLALPGKPETAGAVGLGWVEDVARWLGLRIARSKTGATERGLVETGREDILNLTAALSAQRRLTIAGLF